jgi:hypothetical protein
MEALAVALAFIAIAGWTIAILTIAENGRLRKAIEPFDRDGDGRIGGSVGR